jgi:hypothetical protein
LGDLRNLTLDGDLDLTQQAAKLTVYGRLELNRTLFLGDAAGNTSSILSFGNLGQPTPRSAVPAT